MMEQLTAWFDWIIIDSPPVLPLADTSVWTNLADGILLSHTSRHDAKETVAARPGSLGISEADWRDFE